MLPFSMSVYILPSRTDSDAFSGFRYTYEDFLLELSDAAG